MGKGDAIGFFPFRVLCRAIHAMFWKSTTKSKSGVLITRVRTFSRLAVVSHFLRRRSRMMKQHMYALAGILTIPSKQDAPVCKESSKQRRRRRVMRYDSPDLAKGGGEKKLFPSARKISLPSNVNESKASKIRPQVLLLSNRSFISSFVSSLADSEHRQSFSLSFLPPP